MSASVTSTTVKYKLFSLCVLLAVTGGLVVYRMHVAESGEGELLCGILTAIACVLFAVLAFLQRKRYEPALPHGLPSVTFGAAVVAFLLLTAVISSVYYGYFASADKQIQDINTAVSLLVKTFSLLSTVYFLLTAAYMRLPQKKALHLFFSLAPILFFALRILNDFIDNSTMPLANSGGYHILSMIAAMLFFLSESRFIIGTANVCVYMTLGQIAFLLLALYHIPLLLNILSTQYTELDAIYALLSVSFMIYILTRIFSLRAPAPADTDASET